MNAKQLLDEILGVLRLVKDDKKALGKIHTFMFDEIYEESEEELIPEMYKKVVSSIADSLTAGLVCYFNPKTLEVEDIPETLVTDPDEFEAMTGESWESMNIKHENWEHCIEIKPLQSNDSYRIMENFANQVGDIRFQQKLYGTLNNRKPFANFNHLIHNSDFRQQWFDFRQGQIELHVWQEIEFEIEKLNVKPTIYSK